MAAQSKSDLFMQLKILTYNIHRAIVSIEISPGRIVDILATTTPTSRCLQEVDEGAPRSRELDLARELGREPGTRTWRRGTTCRSGKDATEMRSCRAGRSRSIATSTSRGRAKAARLSACARDRREAKTPMRACFTYSTCISDCPPERRRKSTS